MSAQAALMQAIKQQSEDLREELADLARWENEIKAKDQAVKTSIVTDPDLPPVRGTAPISSSAPKKPKEDPLQTMKEQGNEYFRLNKFDDAVRMYGKGIDMAPDSAASYLLYGNRAQCYLKLGQWDKAEKDSTTCVQMNRTYSKGFYRRAQARKKLGKLLEARADLEAVIALTPGGDAEVEKELAEVTALIRADELKRKNENQPQQRKKLVIEEVEDEDEDVEDPKIVEERNARIAKDLKDLAEQKAQDEERRRVEAKKQEDARERQRKSNPQVEEIGSDDDEEPKAKAPAASAKKEVKQEPAAKKTPSEQRTRTFKQQWTKDNLRAPKSFSEFEKVHSDIGKDEDLFEHYLSLVPPESYTKLFGSSLTPEILMDILKIAARGTAAAAKRIMTGLAAVSRLDEIVMFLEAPEKAFINDVLKLVESGSTTSESAKLRAKFQ